MSKLLKDLLSKAKKAELGHDIHENCIITEVSVTGKPNKEGQPSKWNCVTKFVKYDSKNNNIGEKEVSWYELDFNSDFVKSKFTSQISQLVNILECFITAEEVNDIFDPILGDFEITDEESLESILTDKENCKNLMDDISKAYVKEMINHLNDKPVRLKLVFDNKGKYVGPPMFNELVESMETPKEESKLKFSKNELENEIKSRNVITSAPVNNKTLSSI
jgi:hypothetical protein